MARFKTTHIIPPGNGKFKSKKEYKKFLKLLDEADKLYRKQLENELYPSCVLDN